MCFFAYRYSVDGPITVCGRGGRVGGLASGRQFTVLHTVLSAKNEFVCNDMLVYLDHPVIMKFPSLY